MTRDEYNELWQLDDKLRRLLAEIEALSPAFEEAPLFREALSIFDDAKHHLSLAMDQIDDLLCDIEDDQP